MRHIRLMLVAPAVIALVAVAGLARLHYVHEHDGDFSLTRSATPTWIHLDDRQYRRGDLADPRPACEGLVPRGTTAGSGTILGLADGRLATVLCVIDGDTTAVYALTGGP